MATAESLEWRRRFPTRAVRRFVWFVGFGGGVAAATWVLFGAEPDRLGSGATNPLALVPTVATLLVGLAAAGMLLTVARRPLVVADHYALTVRPGALRTLLLPWATVTEVAGVTVRGEPLLLVRCRTASRRRSGDRPRWFDRAVLRAAGAAVTGYDLAVRMDEFAGSARGQLAALAAWVPEQVAVTDRL
ncbi:MAG: hypothetical protein GEV12_12300 [Micromonosporaceae bacterium]|nr:hypothetical protein [Micromonosporaceae bacterium]